MPPDHTGAADEITYLEAVRLALADAMRDDDRVFLLGEDIGAFGGAFGATAGLLDEFGDARVLDTPSPRRASSVRRSAPPGWATARSWSSSSRTSSPARST